VRRLYDYDYDAFVNIMQYRTCPISAQASATANTHTHTLADVRVIVMDTAVAQLQPTNDAYGNRQ